MLHGVADSFDGRLFGNVDKDNQVLLPAQEGMILNGLRPNNLTDVLRFDTPSTWASLIASDDYTCFPGGTVGDIMYYGQDTSVSDTGPFSNIVKNLQTAVAATSATFVWEYWDGSAWSTLSTASGDLKEWDATGIVALNWEIPSDWATTTVNSITGYWVRCRLSAASGWSTSPRTADNFQVYSVGWPHIEISGTEVAGSMPALVNLKLRSGGNADRYFQMYRILAGSRSVERGSNFQAYINCSDVAVPSGVSFVLGADSSYANYVQYAPTGRAIYYNPSATSTDVDYIVFTCTLASALATH